MKALNVLIAAVCFGFLTVAAAPVSAVEREPDQKPPVLQPAKKYSGDTPIEINNGVSWDNGTYGARNDDYESWAKGPTIVAGLPERKYAFAQKASFVAILQEQVIWVESAIRNWKATTNEFPDALAYSKAAVEKMQPELDQLKSASDKASSSNEGGWDGAEAGARKALIDFRVSYMNLHKNVQARQFSK